MWHWPLFRRFGTELQNRVMGITARLLQVENFNIARNETTQYLYANFRDLGHFSELGSFFRSRGIGSFFDVLGPNQKNESAASPLGFWWQKT